MTGNALGFVSSDGVGVRDLCADVCVGAALEFVLAFAFGASVEFAASLPCSA